MLLVSCSRTVSQDSSHIFSLFNSPISSSKSDSTCRSRNKQLQSTPPLQMDFNYWRDGNALHTGETFPSREIWLWGNWTPWQHNAGNRSDWQSSEPHHRENVPASKTHTSPSQQSADCWVLLSNFTVAAHKLTTPHEQDLRQRFSPVEK